MSIIEADIEEVEAHKSGLVSIRFHTREGTRTKTYDGQQFAEAIRMIVSTDSGVQHLGFRRLDMVPNVSGDYVLTVGRAQLNLGNGEWGATLELVRATRNHMWRELMDAIRDGQHHSYMNFVF